MAKTMADFQNAGRHAVVRTDLLDGTDVRANLVSVMIDEDLGEVDNGNFVTVKELTDKAPHDHSGVNRTVYKAEKPGADDGIKKMVLIASPEVNYDERKKNLDDFTNEVGTIARGYILEARNIFSVTPEAFTAGSAVAGDSLDSLIGSAVGVDAGATKLVVGGTANMIGKIVDINYTTRHAYIGIQVD